MSTTLISIDHTVGGRKDRFCGNHITINTAIAKQLEAGATCRGARFVHACLIRDDTGAD